MDRKDPVKPAPPGQFFRADLGDRKLWLPEVAARGPWDGVVLTAGVHSTHPVEGYPDKEIDRVVSVNFSDHVKAVRDMLPYMAPGGRVIGVSSIGAVIGLPFSSLYSASKAAMEIFYEALSLELRPSHRFAVLIQPGNVNTGFNETGNLYEGPGEGYRSFVRGIHSSLGMRPEKVATVICQALRVPRPKICYVVGANAWKAHLARRLLGRAGALFLLRRYFSLP